MNVMQTKCEATSNVDWAFWFALLSPMIGVSLGALGVFVFAR